jgi:hypothetical protein
MYFISEVETHFAVLCMNAIKYLKKHFDITKRKEMHSQRWILAVTTVPDTHKIWLKCS